MFQVDLFSYTSLDSTLTETGYVKKEFEYCGKTTYKIPIDFCDYYLTGSSSLEMGKDNTFELNYDFNAYSYMHQNEFYRSLKEAITGNFTYKYNKFLTGVYPNGEEWQIEWPHFAITFNPDNYPPHTSILYFESESIDLISFPVKDGSIHATYQ